MATLGFASFPAFIALLDVMRFRERIGRAEGTMLALKPVARRTGWVDKPNFRKAHKGEIPLIGGWSILAVAVLLQLAAPAGHTKVRLRLK